MKVNSLILVFFVLFLVSCSKNEMKISRADKTIVSELVEQSPIYISKDAGGLVSINEKNRIGNTDWVLSIESSLPVGDVFYEVDKLIEKKYIDGMHSDSKKVYVLYLDTLLNKPAFLPIDGYEFVFENPTNESDIQFSKNVEVEKFVQEMVKIATTDTLSEKIKVFIY